MQAINTDPIKQGSADKTMLSGIVKVHVYIKAWNPELPEWFGMDWSKKKKKTKAKDY